MSNQSTHTDYVRAREREPESLIAYAGAVENGFDLRKMAEVDPGGWLLDRRGRLRFQDHTAYRRIEVCDQAWLGRLEVDRRFTLKAVHLLSLAPTHAVAEACYELVTDHIAEGFGAPDAGWGAAGSTQRARLWRFGRMRVATALNVAHGEAHVTVAICKRQ